MNITEEHKAKAKEIRAMLRTLDPRVRYCLATHVQVEENAYGSVEEAVDEVDICPDGAPVILRELDLVLFLKPIDIKYITAENFEIVTEEEK